MLHDGTQNILPYKVCLIIIKTTAMLMRELVTGKIQVTITFNAWISVPILYIHKPSNKMTNLLNYLTKLPQKQKCLTIIRLNLYSIAKHLCLIYSLVCGINKNPWNSCLGQQCILYFICRWDRRQWLGTCYKCMVGV